MFRRHHLNFAEDDDDTLWLSNNSQGALAVVGWVNTRKFSATGDAAQSQGWTALIVDTNGNGKRDEGYNEPGAPADPVKDTRIPFGLYGISWCPADGAVWGSSLSFPGYVIRLDPGPNPPETALAELYKIPLPGFGIRGMDLDRNGVVWAPLASGHIARFDRRKCKGPLNGPGAEKGEKCPERWRFYPLPGPGFAGVPGAAETPYYLWVDQHDIFGLGPNTPIAIGNQSDSLRAFAEGKIVELRVPYPMGFYAKGVDGRINDPAAGWNGKSLWATSGNRTPFHIEAADAPAAGAPGVSPETYSNPLVVQFQLRPDPLAHEATLLQRRAGGGENNSESRAEISLTSFGMPMAGCLPESRDERYPRGDRGDRVPIRFHSPERHQHRRRSSGRMEGLQNVLSQDCRPDRERRCANARW